MSSWSTNWSQVKLLGQFTWENVRDRALKSAFDNFNREMKPEMELTLAHQESNQVMPPGMEKLGPLTNARITVKHYNDVESIMSFVFAARGSSGVILSSWRVRRSGGKDAGNHSPASELFTYTMEQFNETVLQEKLQSLFSEVLKVIEEAIKLG